MKVAQFSGRMIMEKIIVNTYTVKQTRKGWQYKVFVKNGWVDGYESTEYKAIEHAKKILARNKKRLENDYFLFCVANSEVD